MYITNERVQPFLDWAIFDPRNKQLLAASVFSRTAEARNFCAHLQSSAYVSVFIRRDEDDKTLLIGHSESSKEEGGYVTSKPETIFFDQDRILKYQIVHDRVAEADGDFLITSCEESVRDADLYSYLMGRYDLPLKKEWIPKIYEQLMAEGVCTVYDRRTTQAVSNADKNTFMVAAETVDREITVGKRKICLADMILIRIGAAEKKFDRIVSDLIASGETPITTAKKDKKMLPIDVSSMDNYFSQQHAFLIQHVLDSLNVLSKGPGRVDTLACKAKTPYIEQGEAINGLVSLFESGSKYALELCDMGTGKTLMGICTAESFAVRKWLKSHPGKTVKDAYMTKDAINYRVGVMGPGHMIEKWAAEIRKVVPYANVRIITSFSQVAKFKNEKPQGREFLIFGKDFAKGNYMYGPVPTLLKTRRKMRYVCADCLEEGVEVYRDDERTCPRCNGSNWKLPEGFDDEEPEIWTGMICPRCGEMLTTKRDGEVVPLTDLDFMTPTASNQYCSYCKTPLWGVEASPIGEKSPLLAGEDKQTLPKTKWKRMSFFATHTGKTTKSVYVLPQYERLMDGTIEANINPEIWHLTLMENVPRASVSLFDPVGTRKMSPAVWMKKHLNADFFDFLILDEAHQYTNKSVQTHAAHCLIKISKHVLGLTGTLANGTAGNTFQLLWMLDPQKMRKKYSYDSSIEFVEEYGTLEESFYGNVDSTTFAITDKGARIGQKREKPGIAISLYLDYFAEKAVTMSIKDFRAILPDFEEQVVPVEMETALANAYGQMEGSYRCAFSDMVLAYKLGVTHRQHGLYWPDMPNARKVIDPRNGRVLFDLPDLMSLMADGHFTNKERKLIEIASDELSQNRNIVIYIQCTGKGEGRVTERLKDVLVSSGTLKEREIAVLEMKVKPINREQWIKDQACRGMRCLITNPQLVETGLDFIFEEEGTLYNFPTLIYYQIGDKLATMWQSSRRSYRLIQREPCRVYYLAYEQTQAIPCLESIANKEYAASILQGQFSAGALSAMANIVDPKMRMAQALKNGDYGNVNEINAVFAKANYVDHTSEERIDPAPDFYTLTGLVDDLGLDRDESDDIFDAEFTEIDETEEESTVKEDETDVTLPEETEELEAEGEPEAIEKTVEKPKKPAVVEILDSEESEDSGDNWDNWDSADGGWYGFVESDDNSDEDSDEDIVFDYTKKSRRKKYKF